jgi:hypothetical protein
MAIFDAVVDWGLVMHRRGAHETPQVRPPPTALPPPPRREVTLYHFAAVGLPRFDSHGWNNIK